MTMITCISPIDGAVVASRPVASEAEIAAALAAARKAQAGWRRTPISERAAILSRAVDAMLAMKDEIAPELTAQMGRPIRYAAGELRGFEERARHMIAIADEALAPVVPAPREGFTRLIRREPAGLVFTIAPWNYPYLTAVNTVVPALMAGNAVILKHAAQTLLVGERFQMAMDRAGLPRGLFRTLTLDHAATLRIIASGAVNQVCFTGSVEAGAPSSGRRREPSPASGWSSAARTRPMSAPTATGRTRSRRWWTPPSSTPASAAAGSSASMSMRRVRPLRRRRRGADRAYVLGDPREEATTLGPMAQARLAETVRAHNAQALEMGAKAHLDPRAFAADRAGTPYLAPQLFTGVDHRMKVMSEESFGPVIGVMPVRGDDEAIRLMNDSRYGLTAAVFTRDIAAAERIGLELETGTVFANRADYLDPGLAWTGVKDTGRGVSLSTLGYEALTRAKSFHLKHV